MNCTSFHCWIFKVLLYSRYVACKYLLLFFDCLSSSEEVFLNQSGLCFCFCFLVWNLIPLLQNYSFNIRSKRCLVQKQKILGSERNRVWEVQTLRGITFISGYIPKLWLCFYDTEPCGLMWFHVHGWLPQTLQIWGILPSLFHCLLSWFLIFGSWFISVPGSFLSIENCHVTINCHTFTFAASFHQRVRVIFPGVIFLVVCVIEISNCPSIFIPFAFKQNFPFWVWPMDIHSKGCTDQILL